MELETELHGLILLLILLASSFSNIDYLQIGIEALNNVESRNFNQQNLL